MSGPHTEKYDIPEQDHKRLNKLSDVIGDYLESETNAVSAVSYTHLRAHET